MKCIFTHLFTYVVYGGHETIYVMLYAIGYLARYYDSEIYQFQLTRLAVR